MNSDYPHPIIAREGWPFVAHRARRRDRAVVHVGWWLLARSRGSRSSSSLQFFRDPPREVPERAERRAVARRRKHRRGRARRAIPYLERDALKISVFMNVFNVHSNRSPVDGTVAKRWYHAGAFVNAALDKASLENERNALQLRTAAGVDVTCVQVAGLIARRILCYVEPGDTARARPALRLHPLRLARRRLPARRRRRRSVAVGDKVYATDDDPRGAACADAARGDDRLAGCATLVCAHDDDFQTRSARC